MQKLIMESFGAAGLSLVDTAPPAPLKRDEVRVRVHAASLNYLDLLVINGKYNSSIPLPHTPGSDAAGEVVAVGAEVEEFAVGDEVITHFFIDWRGGDFSSDYFANRYGSEGPGVFSQEIVVPERGLVAKPPYMTFAEAATLPVAGLTAWVSLVEDLRPIPGSRILILGTGAVSTFALQIATLMGLDVAVVVSSAAAGDYARRLGAAHVIDRSSTPDYTEAVLSAFPGGADAIIDVTGDLSRCLSMLATGGTIKSIGFVAAAKSEVDIAQLLGKHATIKGNTPGSRASFRKMLRAFSARQLRPVIHMTYPLQEAKAAIAALTQEGRVGKIVLDLS